MFEQFAPLVLMLAAVALLIVSWDILIAGWMTAKREAPTVFTRLTGLCGLLIAPALVVSVAAGTEDGARTVSGIVWLLPVVCAAFVCQTLYAVLAGLLSPLIALPILFYNVAVMLIAAGDFLVATTGAAPLPLQAAVAARDVLMGMAGGRASLVSPFVVVAPMIAPAFRARWRLSALARALMVLFATAATTLWLIEWPRGFAAVRSYERANPLSVQARPLGDFTVGMRFFPVLSGPPPARMIRANRELADSLTPDAVFVVLDMDGTRAEALDSLARVLQPLRNDSVSLAVALYHGREPLAANDPSTVAAIDRVLRKLRPHVLFPAISTPMPSVTEVRTPSLSWWRLLFRTADGVRARVRPGTRLGMVLSRLDARDSALYAWTTGHASPIDVVGAVIYPSFSGVAGLDARLRTFDRWHARADTAGVRAPTHWLLNVGGLPHAHGDASQSLAMRRALAWGSRRPWITSVMFGEPGDYDGWTGVRSANGRIRDAWSAMSAETKALRDARTNVAR